MSADNIHEFKQQNDYVVVDSLSEISRTTRGHSAELLAGVYADKAIDPQAVQLLAHGNVIGGLLNAHVMGNAEAEQRRGNDDAAVAALNGIAIQAARIIPHKTPQYSGTIDQNRTVITGNYHAESYRRSDLLRKFRKNGATRHFETGHVNLVGTPELEDMRTTPIAIIGAGAAGTLTARALYELGYSQVDVIDQRGQVGGIWQQANVKDGSKNNPFSITFDNVTTRAASEIRGSSLSRSGGEITDYIETVARRSRRGANNDVSAREVTVTKGLVRGIEPGDLSHLVRVEIDGKEEIREYPIVIYAPGIGKPLPIANSEHMNGQATRSEAGTRWQQQLSDEKLKELEGKRLAFIGLGNSTAEMVTQLQQYEDRTGRVVDYRIVTHKPTQMIHDPDTNFGDNGKLYRDTSIPELTRLAGDLPSIDRMYTTAQDANKIVAGVTDWHVDAGKLLTTDRDGIQTSIPYDRLFTLIGYGQDAKTLSDVGITSNDAYHGTASLDYDGEVQKTPGITGRDRLHPGYFAIGPIAKNVHNPNAIVIPGIQYQLNDMLTTITLRAAEYASRHPEKLAEAKRARLAALVLPRQTTLPEIQASPQDTELNSYAAIAFNSLLKKPSTEARRRRLFE